jgi:4'-phosphopantetheinyl transferase
MDVRCLPLDEAARPLPDGEVHLYYADVGRYSGSVERFLGMLSEKERARAHRFVSIRDGGNYIVVRGWLRALLGAYTDTEPGTLEFVDGSHGKPMLAGAAGPGGIRFNVSHSGGRALFAFARDRNVGVDVEKMGNAFSGEGISDRFFAPREAASIRSFDGSRRQEVFFSYWTLKEAYMKASGRGLSLPMHRFEVALDPPRVVHVQGDPEAASRWHLETIHPEAGYAAALAVEVRDVHGREAR